MHSCCEPQPVIADCLVQCVPAVPLYVVLWQGGVLDSGTQTSPAVVYFSLVALSLSQQTVAAPWDTLPRTATWGMVDVNIVTDMTASYGVLVSF